MRSIGLNFLIILLVTLLLFSAFLVIFLLLFASDLFGQQDIYENCNCKHYLNFKTEKCERNIFKTKL